MKEELVNRIRQLQMLISIFVFIGVTIQCWTVTGLDITKIQISQWGADSDTWWLWNGAIMLVSVAILFNVIWWIYKHPRLRYKNIFYIIFSVLSVLLFMVGLFPTGQYKLLHDIPAFTYFFVYPFTIFAMAFLNRKRIQYKEWIKHLVLSIIMIILPLAFIKAFDGMGVSEILHTVIVAIWNMSLLAIKKKDGIKTENQVN